LEEGEGDRGDNDKSGVITAKIWSVMTSYFQDSGHDVYPSRPPDARYPAERVWRHWLAVCATVPDP